MVSRMKKKTTKKKIAINREEKLKKKNQNKSKVESPVFWLLQILRCANVKQKKK